MLDGPPQDPCGYPGITAVDRRAGNLYVCGTDGRWRNNGPSRNLPVIVPSAPSTTIDLSLCPISGICVLVLNLTANTTVSLANLSLGTQIVLQVCNGPTMYTWTPPPAMHGVMSSSIGPNTCNVQEFSSFNGQTLIARSGGVNETP